MLDHRTDLCLLASGGQASLLFINVPRLIVVFVTEEAIRRQVIASKFSRSSTKFGTKHKALTKDVVVRGPEVIDERSHRSLTIWCSMWLSLSVVNGSRHSKVSFTLLLLSLTLLLEAGRPH